LREPPAAAAKGIDDFGIHGARQAKPGCICKMITSANPSRLAQEPISSTPLGQPGQPSNTRIFRPGVWRRGGGRATFSAKRSISVARVWGGFFVTFRMTGRPEMVIFYYGWGGRVVSRRKAG
jgi:hypothetical protein